MIFQAGAALLSLYLVSKLVSWWQLATFCSKNGCKPAAAISQKPWLLGFDMVRNFMHFGQNNTFLSELTKLFDEYGRTFSLRMAGDRMIFTTQPENVKAMLATQADDFELSNLRLNGFKPYIGLGVASSTGPAWAHGRALLRPSFTRAQVGNLGIYEKHFQNLVARIPTDGSTVDLKLLFARLTVDVAVEVLFGDSGLSLQTQRNKKNIELDEAFELATKGVRDRFNMGPLMFLHRDPAFFRSIKLIHEYADAFIERALQKADSAKELEGNVDGKGRYIFVDELVKSSKDKNFLRDQLLSGLVGGRDTTLGLLSHVVLHLSRNPRVLQTLRDEISQLDGVPPTYEQLKDMKYLRFTLDETLRLTPPAVLYDRVAKRDAILPVGGGVGGTSPLFVRKGETVTFAHYVLNHSKEQWGEDAEEFRPERWKGLKYSWDFTPFGGGARVCPGQQLALTQGSYIIVRLLQTFSGLESRDDSPWQEELGITLVPGNGVKVALTKG